MSMDAIVGGSSEVSCDVLVIGGGTAGPMAALKAKLKNPKANVVLLEKANVKRSGARRLERLKKSPLKPRMIGERVSSAASKTPWSDSRFQLSK